MNQIWDDFKDTFNDLGKDLEGFSAQKVRDLFDEICEGGGDA